jgi:sulfite reductase beta subunit-like hemoprotein
VRIGDAVDGFDIFVGGGLGAAPTFAERAGVRVAATDAPDALEAMFRDYLGTRVADETFRSWAARVGPQHVKSALVMARSLP